MGMKEGERIGCRIVFSTLLRSLAENPSVHSIYSINLENGDENGLFEMENVRIQLSRVIIGDGDEGVHYQLVIAEHAEHSEEEGESERRMTVLTAKSVDSELVELDISRLQENAILDLNDEGRRWEGGLLNGQPFGFGREFSEEGNLVYEGFVFDGHRVCVGKEFHDDGNNNRCVYEGGYCNGKRWGRGISHDLNGDVDFAGEWMDNRIIDTHVKNEVIVPMGIDEFVIDDEKFNDEQITSLHFSPLLVRLKSIEIGNECFKYVREFEICNCPELISLHIGECSFTVADKTSEITGDDGIVQIHDCSKLQSIKMDGDAFLDYHIFEIRGMF